MRANHFHPVQEQKCLIIKGQFISIYKDLVDDKSIKVTHVVNEGDILFIMEVMKSEVNHNAPIGGTIVEVNIHNDQEGVSPGTVAIVIE